ncbi:MAG: NAD(+)/NADH kinase, partial [Lachnospiraceae bacterium]
MENFYIITNDSKDQSGEITQEIKSYLEEKGRSCVLEQKDGEGNVLVGTVPKDLDCVIVIGGDGTLIQAARDLIAFDLPLLGVNMGTLGYLAEIEVQNIRSAIDQLLDEKPMIEERMMLKG